MKKIAEITKKVFGIMIVVSLFAGGIAFFGYVIALFIGGETAAAICAFIFKKYFPLVIRFTSVSVLIGLISMYLQGEKSLTVMSGNDSNK